MYNTLNNATIHLSTFTKKRFNIGCSYSLLNSEYGIYSYGTLNINLGLTL